MVLEGNASSVKRDTVRAGALDRLVDRMSAAESRTPEAMPAMAADAVAALEQLYDKEPDALYRRHAVARLFGTTSAALRDYIPFHPEAAWAARGWKKLDALRRRGLRGRDARLAEFFERYVPLPRGAAWKPVKAAMKSRFDRAVADLPERREGLEMVWGFCQRIEDGQRTVRDRLLAKLHKSPGAGTKEGRRRERLFLETFDYRMHSTWGNMLPKAVEEQLGSDEAARRGFKADPIKLGWAPF